MESSHRSACHRLVLVWRKRVRPSSGGGADHLAHLHPGFLKSSSNHLTSTKPPPPSSQLLVSAKLLSLLWLQSVESFWLWSVPDRPFLLGGPLSIRAAIGLVSHLGPKVARSWPLWPWESFQVEIFGGAGWCGEQRLEEEKEREKVQTKEATKEEEEKKGWFKVSSFKNKNRQAVCSGQ